MTRGLEHYRETWMGKPALQLVYREYHQRIVTACRGGRTLELGGGSGNLKHHHPDVIASDVQFAPWLDVVADAQSLPFGTQSFDNLVMVDVLHHLSSPVSFFEEACRVLSPRGRIIMLEPAVTFFSWFFYRFLHHEPLILDQDPLADSLPRGSQRCPYTANQAIPTLLFGRHRGRFEQRFPQLVILSREFTGLWAYPLSGGFKRWSLTPLWLIPSLLKLENRLAPWIGYLLAFRMLVVLELKPA